LVVDKPIAGNFMIAPDHENARQAGFGLSFSGGQARPLISVAFSRLAVLAALAVCVVKVSFGLAGWAN
jgi:hypothetical protein